MVLRVRDNGCGIDPKMIDRIFAMFVQARDSRQRVRSGLGIGLAFARRIAELHGGTLEGHSEGEDKGSEFILRLPLSDIQTVGTENDHAVREPQTKPIAPRRVLVVDDQVEAASTLDALVRSLGHQTRGCMTVLRPSRSPPNSVPTSFCSISACPVSMVTKSRGACDPQRRIVGCESLRLRAGVKTRTEKWRKKSGLTCI